jgi:hypothetical protein
MPAYCHNNRSPLFAAAPGPTQRLPEPSPPPWVNCRTPPADFYRPIFRPGLAFVAIVPPIVLGEGEP